MKSGDRLVKATRAGFDRLRRGPLLIGMVLTEPAMSAQARKDALSTLKEAMAGNDAAKAGDACRSLVASSRTAPLGQVGRWHSELKTLSGACSSRFRENLRAACESVRSTYRERALQSDSRPEEVRRKADALLLEAAKNGDLEGVKRALAYGADVHAKDEKGLTAMLHAMGEEVYFDIPVQKYPEIVDFLRERMLAEARKDTHEGL